MTALSRIDLGWRDLLLVAVEALVIVAFLPYGWVFTADPTDHYVQLLAQGLGGLLGLIALMRRPSALRLPVVLAPLPLLAAMVVAAWFSAYPSLSWTATWQTAAYAGVFWLLAIRASQPNGRRNLLMVIGIVVTLTMASFLVAVALEWRQWLRLGFSISSLPLRPSNAGGLARIPTWLADVVVLGIPVVVAALWQRGARIPAAALVVVALGALVLTGTRSVLLLVAAVSVVAVGMVVRERAGRRLVTAATIAVLTGAILGTILVLGTSRSFDEGRSSAYASAVARITESPALGAGPGTYGVRRMGDAVDVLGYLGFPDAHNIVLTTMAETGFVGLLGLLGTLTLLGLAIRRSWGASRDGRLVIAGALFGLAVFAAHGLVDVVFGLVGIIVLAIAVVAVASTSAIELARSERVPPRHLRAGLGAAALVFVLVSSVVLRTEMSARAVAAADAASLSAPAHALALARGATASTPDLAPAWWAEMVAADAAGDPEAAIAAARKTIQLEGFGQEWMSLAILASRQHDTATELDAIAHATGHPPADPLVELNVVSLLGAAGDGAGAASAARRLIDLQPDIERIVRTGPAAMAAVLAAVRADAAAARLAGGDVAGAVLIALSGEDQPLAERLVTQVATTDPGQASAWRMLIAAWAGDKTARAKVDAAARATPTLDGALWAWRLAGRACDKIGMRDWEGVVRIGFRSAAREPAQLVVAPTGQAGPLPAGYPQFVWRLGPLKHQYVAGTWTYSLGRPACG